MSDIVDHREISASREALDTVQSGTHLRAAPAAPGPAAPRRRSRLPTFAPETAAKAQHAVPAVADDESDARASAARSGRGAGLRLAVSSAATALVRACRGRRRQGGKDQRQCGGDARYRGHGHAPRAPSVTRRQPAGKPRALPTVGRAPRPCRLAWRALGMAESPRELAILPLRCTRPRPHSGAGSGLAKPQPPFASGGWNCQPMSQGK